MHQPHLRPLCKKKDWKQEEKEVDRKICHEHEWILKCLVLDLKQLLSSSHSHAYITMHIEVRFASAFDLK